MKRHLFLILLPVFLLLSCKNSKTYVPVEISGQQLLISDSIPANDSLSAFIEPYKEHIDREMNTVLAYTPTDLKKTDGELNTAIGNLMADAVMELSSPVFKSRTGNSIDLVLLNHGGIRSSISRGDITTRTAYQVMPFENEVVVAALKGEHVRELIRYLIDSGSAHPVAGLELLINANNAIEKMLIQGEPLQEEKTYYVATNDYLFQGGDNMSFFSKATDVTSLDYKIRNLLIDYFKAQDTIAPVRDQRFIRVE